MVDSNFTVILTVVLVIFGIVVIQAMFVGFLLTKWALGNVKKAKKQEEITEEEQLKLKKIKEEQEAFTKMLDTNIEDVYKMNKKY